MTTHILKTWPEPFQAVLDGRKAYELRVNDRKFLVGDFLALLEYDPNASERDPYTGRNVLVEVTYMTRGGHFGLPEGMCVMGIRRPAPEEPQETAVPCGVCRSCEYGLDCRKPSPNAERALAWLAQEGVHRAVMTPPADNVVRGRKEERNMTMSEKLPQTVDGISRRARIDLQTPAEAAIRAAVAAVEALPADVRLTNAVIKLLAAQELVADFLEGVDREAEKKGGG